MKEATSELNSTVITVVAVAAFAVFFFSILWPMIRNTIDLDQKCSGAICENCQDGFCTCRMKKDDTDTFQCVYKG